MRRAGDPSARATFVVLGSSSTALALGRRIQDVGGHPIHVDTEDHAGGIATRSRVWRRRHRAARGAEGLECLRRIGAEHGGPTKPFLVGTGDDDLWFIWRHREVLDAWFDVLHPANDALATCLDKVRFVRFCGAHGVATPSWFVTAATPDAIRAGVAAHVLPLVVRAASSERGATSFPKMFVVQGSGEVDVLVEHARRSLRPEDRLLFGESLLGRDLVRYSVAFCRARRQFHAFEATKERPAAVTGGVGTFVRLTEAPAAREMARRVAEALDYYGMGEMEVFHDRRHGRHYAIEINARPWMQLGMERLAGRDFVGFLAGFSDGSRGVPRPGAAWADVLGDLYGRYSRTGRATAAGEPGYLRSFASVRSFKYFAVRDPGPAIVEMGRWIDAAIRRRLTGRGT